MIDYTFNLSDTLAFNDTVINGTSGYTSSYVILYGMDFLVALNVLQALLLFFLVGYMIIGGEFRWRRS